MTFKSHLLKRYPGGFDLDLEIEFSAGIHVLFGPSGSGKTTALRIIAGVTKADAGYVQLDDVSIFDTVKGVDLPVHLRGIVLLFQEDSLFPHLDGLTNVAYGSGDRIAARELLERFNLGHLAKRRPAQMSGGERRRIALLRAWATNPRMMLLDEPLSGVDRPAQREILTALRELQNLRQIPILYVSHSLQECQQVGDTVTVIKAGRKVLEGLPEKVLSHNELKLIDLGYE